MTKQKKAAPVFTPEEIEASVTGEAIAEVQQEGSWTPEQLLAVRHLGPGIIGEAMHKASQRYDKQTTGGKFGPALL